MTSEVLINAGAGEIRVARVVDGRLQDYSFTRTIGAETRANGSRIGDVILGRVQRVVPGMQAAFVDIGQSRAGFLALREALVLGKSPDADISACVREGEAILVQIIKDPLGEKGARLSAGVTLPGCLLVMTPGQPGLALSRRIESEEQRAALTALGTSLLQDARLSPGNGFIFRTAAQGASLDDLLQDALVLNESWRTIQDKAKAARPPATLYHDLGPVERTLRDAVRSDVARVLIDDAAAADAARDYCRRAMPGAESKIALVPDAFAHHDLEEEIARLSDPRVALPSGGWITIEATEALTAIDVNSGSYNQASGLEDTGHAVNLEAAAEMGRQLRLRGIGGLIVADFIHMDDPAHREQVLAALADSLGFDHAPVQLSPLWEFGIVAITRKRVREPLVRLTSQPCPACGGGGRAATPESVAQVILRRVEREARAMPGREWLVTAAPSVAAWFQEQGPAVGEALARRGAGRVRFAAGAHAREGFDVKAV